MRINNVELIREYAKIAGQALNSEDRLYPGSAWIHPKTGEPFILLRRVKLTSFVMWEVHSLIGPRDGNVTEKKLLSDHVWIPDYGTLMKLLPSSEIDAMPVGCNYEDVLALVVNSLTTISSGIIMFFQDDIKPYIIRNEVIRSATSWASRNGMSSVANGRTSHLLGFEVFVDRPFRMLYRRISDSNLYTEFIANDDTSRQKYVARSVNDALALTKIIISGQINKK